jgi:uncharacterized protein YycO
VSIERDDGVYVAICDDCGDTEDFNLDDFSDVVDAMKERGWKSKKIDNEWENHCPDCVKSEKESIEKTLGELPTLEGNFFGQRQFKKRIK